MTILSDYNNKPMSWTTYELPCDKTNKVSACPAKTQISLDIRPVWSESLLCAQWVAKDPSFPHADSEDSDQTGLMPRLSWVFAGRTTTLLVLPWGGSIIYNKGFLTIQLSDSTCNFFFHFFLSSKFLTRLFLTGILKEFLSLTIVLTGTVKREIFASSNFCGISRSVSIREN